MRFEGYFDLPGVGYWRELNGAGLKLYLHKTVILRNKFRAKEAMGYPAGAWKVAVHIGYVCIAEFLGAWVF